MKALRQAFVDGFYIYAIAGLALACLVPFMKRCVVEKRAAVAAK